MKILIVILIALYASLLLLLIIFAIKETIADKKEKSFKKIFADSFPFWLLLPILPILIPIFILISPVTSRISEIRRHGGIKGYRKWKDDLKQEEIERQRKKEEEKRLTQLYTTGAISRLDLPKKENGINKFEFDESLGLSVDYEAEVRQIIYVERDYNERLNRFFLEHPDLRLYHMYKFLYLPRLGNDLEDALHYSFPGASMEGIAIPTIDSTYPIDYLVYQEDAANIKHGMFFFVNGKENCGAKYTQGQYYPLEEGSDEEIIQQLHTIVRAVHSQNGNFYSGGVYCTEKKPDIPEGTTENYADQMYDWEFFNEQSLFAPQLPDDNGQGDGARPSEDEIKELVNGIKQRLQKLNELGVEKSFLMKLLQPKTRFSRLVVTKDYKILLPDYHNMEIHMEPLVKAVYLLFLRHPEGILFKHLPDYRKELTGIYVKLKPYGMNERVMKSIEDVTNPTLNSINEKCARIRGAFISRFEEDLAQHYYIFGFRGDPKKIKLDRSLVIWE